MNWQQTIADIITGGILLYTAIVILSRIFLAVYSVLETRRYLRKSSFTDFSILAVSEKAPSVSILATAYNQGATIVQSVRALLRVHYHNMELIVINDGSEDDSLQQLINAYDLVETPRLFVPHIIAKETRGIYCSSNPVYKKLIVVDKENGGKADALNVGINVSRHDYIVCIDVECVLEQNAMLRLIKPLLEEKSVKVIATGGAVRISNGSEINDGRMEKVNLPDRVLPRIQTLEYIRASSLQRVAWSRLNGVLVTAGNFGAFDRDIVIRAGGYNTDIAVEDMELLLRMRRYMEEVERPYKVTYIPDTLCWKPAPSTYSTLGSQRKRWTTGMVDTLKMHRQMLFNPRYGSLGMISYPYWLFFELLTPVIGLVNFIILACFCLAGLAGWPFFFAFLGFVFSFGFLYSGFAILVEVLTYNRYKTRRDVLSLLYTALLEPLIFHPFIVWCAVRGFTARFSAKRK